MFTTNEEKGTDPTCLFLGMEQKGTDPTCLFLVCKPGVAGWRLKPARRGSPQQSAGAGGDFPLQEFLCVKNSKKN